MSNANINKEFADFGKRMNTIAILTLLSFILGIIGALVFIVQIGAYILSFIIIIFFLLVLGNTKRAGRELNNKELLDFKPRFLWGTIIRFIGQVLWSIGMWAIGDIISRRASSPIGGLILIVVIGVILIIVGSILRFKAWSGLATFFEANVQIFTQRISGKANTGAKLCKIATILDMTIILSFIGEILRIIGYFMLSGTKRIGQAPAQPVYQPAAPQPATISTPSAPSANFCPNCGSTVVSGAKFCPNCGSDIS